MVVAVVVVVAAAAVAVVVVMIIESLLIVVVSLSLCISLLLFRSWMSCHPKCPPIKRLAIQTCLNFGLNCQNLTSHTCYMPAPSVAPANRS